MLAVGDQCSLAVRFTRASTVIVRLSAERGHQRPGQRPQVFGVRDIGTYRVRKKDLVIGVTAAAGRGG